MKGRLIKFVSLFLVLALTAALSFGCNSAKNGGETTQPASSSAEQTTQPPAETSAAAIYPLDTDVTLTYWKPLHNQVAKFADDDADVPFYQELMKRTGINIEFINCGPDQTREAFGILVASRDLPDIVCYPFEGWYPGGPTKAIKDEVIIPLNEAFEKWSPNISAYLAKNTDAAKQMKTDDGYYYSYARFADPALLSTGGPMIRKDWLDDLGLDFPETIDDWYTMLKAFKEEKNASAPFTIQNGSDSIRLDMVFESAFNLAANYGSYGFCVIDGKVKYGAVEPAYRDYLETMAKWYSEGLIDKNYTINDKPALDALILNGNTGSTHGTVSDIDKYMKLKKDTDSKFELSGARYPVARKGDIPTVGRIDKIVNTNSMPAITTACKNVEIAARLCDYGYSEEGYMLFNYGTEGVSYNMVNGEPVLADIVMNDPDGKPWGEALLKYAMGSQACPAVQDGRMLIKGWNRPQQVEALERFSYNKMASTVYPPVSLTTEESKEYSQIITDIETYVKEMKFKYIMGEEPLSSFDNYISELKKLKVERLIEINQQAYDRYMKR